MKFCQSHASPEITFKQFLENVLSSYKDANYCKAYPEISNRDEAVDAIMHVVSCPICTRATKLNVYQEQVIRFKKLEEGAQMPRKAYATDAAYDMYALITTDLLPGIITEVPTGIALEMPYPIYATFEGRSSFHIKNIITTRGIIDNEYRGEVSPYIINNSDELYTIKKGERCAQLIFHYGVPTKLVVSQELSETERGVRGTGSTGKF